MSGMGTYYLDGAKMVGVPLNMADAQQVDVVKGPDSVLTGARNPGGWLTSLQLLFFRRTHL